MKSSRNEQGAEFGNAVGLSSDGNTLAVAAFRQLGQRGAAYVFTRSGAQWLEQAQLRARPGLVGGDVGDEFGESLALSSETAILSR